MNDTNRIVGKISYVDDEGWGFILSKEIEFTRIFFHWTGLTQDTLHFKEVEKGMKVEFLPIQIENKGWRAIKIKVIEDERHDSTEDGERVTS